MILFNRVFSLILMFSATILNSQDVTDPNLDTATTDQYYYDDGTYPADDGTYTYPTEDGTYPNADGTYAYPTEDGTYPNADGTYAYPTEDGTYPNVDGTYTYPAEDGADTTDETPEVEAPTPVVEEPQDTAEVVTNIFVPILQVYRSPNIIDPTNLSLPPNHQIVRMRGTVWRSDDTVLLTNTRGVISEQRLFIFFSRERDAISYEYALAQSRNIPAWPEKSSFIPLFPLTQTNPFVPTPVANINLTNNLSNASMRPVIQPNIMRNYEYEKALETLIRNVTNNRESYTTIHTNTTVTTNKIERQFTVVTNNSISVTTNVTGYDVGSVVNVEQSTIAITNIVDINQNSTPPQVVEVSTDLYYDISTNYNDMPIEEYYDISTNYNDMPIEEYYDISTNYNDMPIEEYYDISTNYTDMPIEEYYDISTNYTDMPPESYYDPTDTYYNGDTTQGDGTEYSGSIDNLYDVYSQAKYLPQRMFAQEISTNSTTTILTNSHYIVNAGGENGGIFIHETGDVDNPYRVIFLSLDQGVYLYEYNINSSFDARNDKIQASKQARDLYGRILNERINMRRFKRVNLQKTFVNDY